ncbi:MAG: response regulator [Aggregatilineales bacterium]
MRIVYVEDNIANVFLVQRVAKMGAHTVIHYIDGNEFLKKYEQANPDMILMDIQLAGGYSGLDLVRKFRESGHTIPVIAVTAYAMVGDKERCIEAGCDEYMAKPLAIAQMVKLFEEYSKQAEDRAATASLPDKPQPEAAKEDSDTVVPASGDKPISPPTTVASSVHEPTVTHEFPTLKLDVSESETTEKDDFADKPSTGEEAPPSDDLYMAKTMKLQRIQIVPDALTPEKTKDSDKKTDT